MSTNKGFKNDCSKGLLRQSSIFCLVVILDLLRLKEIQDLSLNSLKMNNRTKVNNHLVKMIFLLNFLNIKKQFCFMSQVNI